MASPHNQKRTTTNLKTKNNQICQKIKLYGVQHRGVKDETFIQTGRKVRDRQPGQRNMARWRLEAWVGKTKAGGSP